MLRHFIFLSIFGLSLSAFSNDFKWIKSFEGGSSNYDYSKFDGISIWINPVQSCCNYTTDFNPYFHEKMLDEVKKSKKIPVFYAYIIAFEARYKWKLKDCDVGEPSLCTQGAEFIRKNRDLLVKRYEHWASKISEYLGRSADCLFFIETDFYFNLKSQYYSDKRQKNGGISGEEMRKLYDDFAKTIRKYLPNSKLSWDISFWPTQDQMKKWWGYFKTSQYIDFINTSDGVGRGDSDFIKFKTISYSFMNQLTGRKIFTDCGYGVAGAKEDNCKAWNNKVNAENRLKNGVVGVGVNFVPSFRPRTA